MLYFMTNLISTIVCTSNYLYHNRIQHFNESMLSFVISAILRIHKDMMLYNVVHVCNDCQDYVEIITTIVNVYKCI